MKNSFFSKCKNTLKSIPAVRILAIAALFILVVQAERVHAQAKLSVQGILKKSSGEAVPDDNYQLTFRLYTSATPPGAAIWTETQPSVEVVSGIYSATLGNITSFNNVPFNQDYFLGVTVGDVNGTEMTPRVQLTSAPYALSIRGVNNQFPNSGQVIADSIKVNGNVLTETGAPGANGANKNGYGFIGERDSGLFSVSNGQVSLYVNNVRMLTATPDSIAARSDLRLNNNSNINYNGLDDWRLVETDYFETDAESWKVYSPPNPNPPIGAWNQTNGVAATVTSFNDAFAGKALMPTAQGQVFKKQFTLPGGNVAGTYTYVKVVFNYYYLNSWDLGAAENGWAAFSKTENCTELSVGWFDQAAYVSFGNNLGNNAGQFGPAANFLNGDQGNNPAQWSDQWKTEEMVSRYPSGPSNSSFFVIFGNANDEGVGTENYAVGMIEIWVK